ncbi:MAG TPA: RDD family protein [Pseudobdellovibrionaceae bacterium]|nr:RDD family protein [Pseudobdellovibrionaceae bacterium]
MGTDPFEEFEFKPLTEGLGFHQKPEKQSAPAAPASPTLETFQARGLDFNEVVPTPATESLLKAPLPRRELKSPKSTPPPSPTTSPVDDILNTLQKNRKIEIELDRQHRQELRQSNKKTENWKTAAPKFSPMLLDAMLITAASLLCMIIMLIVTRVDLITNLSNPDTEGFIYLSTFSLFAAVSFIYMVIHRVFLGFTPGEWAYDLRVGHPNDQGKALFSLQVVARQLVITATGLLPLPLIGWIVGKDLVGKITGATLYRKV